MVPGDITWDLWCTENDTGVSIPAVAARSPGQLSSEWHAQEVHAPGYYDDEINGANSWCDDHAPANTCNIIKSA